MNNKLSIILASGSKIRHDILKNAGLDFTVINKPVDEAAIKQAMLQDRAKFSDIADALAEAKAMRVSQVEAGFVIGADQIMLMDGQLFDKPKSQDEARDRLKNMRGKKHELIGAVVICENGQPIWRHLSKTQLYMRDFSDEFLNWYIHKEGEHLLHSVGGYRFEAYGAQLFSKVDGDFFSILGLSLLPILSYLSERGAILS